MASNIHYNECANCIGGDKSRPALDGMNHQHRSQNSERHNEMKQTEDFLASELLKLSVQERAEAFDDVHCVGEQLKETPELIEKSLAEFEVAVQKERTSVYDMAWNQNRAYVEDHSFRLKFLRAKMYNVDQSVRQMMRFLQHKATYFGNDKVARDITLDDLNEEDLEVIRSGMWHIQEEPDRTGRVIMHAFGNMIGRFKAENSIRAAYTVFFNILIQDPCVQRMGIVSMYHNVGRAGEDAAMPGLDFILTVSDVAMSFPIRYSAMHYCLYVGKGNLNWNNYFLGLALNAVPKYSKARTRIHVGSCIELQYQLRSHGIPLDTFPIDMHGNARKDILNVWFDKYYYQQEQRNDGKQLPSKHDFNMPMSVAGKTPATSWEQKRAASGIPMPSNQIMGSAAQRNLPVPSAASVAFAVAQPSAMPSENDVLLGRGKFSQSWAGNVKFREFVEWHSDDYDRLSRFERQRRTIELTNELIGNGIRFLKQKEDMSGEWVEADFAEARQRVSQMFRTVRKKK